MKIRLGSNPVLLPVNECQMSNDGMLSVMNWRLLSFDIGYGVFRTGFNDSELLYIPNAVTLLLIVKCIVNKDLPFRQCVDRRHWKCNGYLMDGRWKKPAEKGPRWNMWPTALWFPYGRENIKDQFGGGGRQSVVISGQPYLILFLATANLSSAKNAF